jgi:YgiT-type zinc finger domain-containing protein
MCGYPEVRPDLETIVLPHQSGREFTIRGVPSSVCPGCGAAMRPAWLIADIFDTMDAAVKSGFEGTVLEYVPKPRPRAS